MADLHLDATLGVAGDMLLAALVDAGADIALIQECVGAVAPEARISFSQTHRQDQRATRLQISISQKASPRDWGTIRSELSGAGLPVKVLAQSLSVFDALARAEARVHGTHKDSVHFHEVGATDALVDVVGSCAALISLSPDRITSGRIATGTGYANTAHGRLPVPVPAVLELLATTEATVIPGPAEFEACTPTGAALLATWTQDWLSGPTMTVDRIGVGAGSRDPAGHPNITRIFMGSNPNRGTTQRQGSEVLLECNIDDMDPRLWPSVLDSLMVAGARDAWLTPILMKKGRPAHTLHVLTSPEQSTVLTALVMEETSSIGLRMSTVDKLSLHRRTETVEVMGRPVRVKLAFLADQLVNIQPEWDDVASIAELVDIPAKTVLRRATTAATAAWG